jgi:hypothetical protein
VSSCGVEAALETSPGSRLGQDAPFEAWQKHLPRAKASSANKHFPDKAVAVRFDRNGKPTGIRDKAVRPPFSALASIRLLPPG